MTWVKGLAKPLVIGLLIREFLAPFTGHPWDFEIWVRLGVLLQSGTNPYSLLPSVSGLSFAPYASMTSISYPPLPALIFAVIYRLYTVLGSVSPFLYYFLLKQPMVLSDALVALLLFRLLAPRGDEDRARKIASLWLYFPFAVIVSAMWGALDPIALLLTLAALYSFESNRTNLSAVFLGFAVFMKLMPVIFLPVFLIDRRLTLNRIPFVATTIAIPALGTAIPTLVFSWGFFNFYNAVSYQAALPAFGGMSIFFPLALTTTPDLLAFALGSLWLPALLLGYVFLWNKKFGLAEGLLLTVLIFSVSRTAVPEQWAVYPMALLLVTLGGEAWRHFVAITGIASAFLVTNNALLVRFFSPSSLAAFNWDQYVDNASAFSDFRYALLVAFSTLFFAEGISVITGKKSFLFAKLKVISAVSARGVLPSLVYLGIVSATGGLLDFTVTKMITDWKLAIESHVFLGLSWLSLYHIMLVVVFESVAFIVVSFSWKNFSQSVGLLILLTSLNVAASGLALVIFNLLDGAPILATTPIYLAGSLVVSERFFLTFVLLTCGLGILYLAEIRWSVLLVPKALRRAFQAVR